MRIIILLKPDKTKKFKEVDSTPAKSTSLARLNLKCTLVDRGSGIILHYMPLYYC